MSSGAPCGACKFLRRKCVRGCIFAPYFGAEQGAARFAAVHKIFGASNVAKLLLHIPVPRRCDAVLTISYEAQARLSDPVYGCVATIFALQQQTWSCSIAIARQCDAIGRSPTIKEYRRCRSSSINEFTACNRVSKNWVASLQAELAMVQAQLVNRQAVVHQIHQHQQQHHQHHHHLQQQHEQISTMSPGHVPSSAYMQQHEHSQLSPSDISMSIPSGSGSVKEEGNSFLGMQHYGDLGLGSSSLEPMSGNQHSLLENIHKPRGGGENIEQTDHEGDLQALALLLRRK
uniref:LOB domain-containing protein n=1 Tax=Physcomitrium patens TaxID=3218 RepID=A0A7I4EMU9_PHYPA